MKNIKTLLILLLAVPMLTLAQDKNKKTVKKDKPQRPAFENTWLIDNPTSIVFKKGTLQFDIQHRFGTVNGKNDMFGIWAPANIKLGVNYSFTDNITLGLGTTKDNRLVDLNLRVALLRQMRSNKIPVNVTFYGNATIDTRLKENFDVNHDRYSSFYQIIISRRFNRIFSFQLAPSLSHYNIVKTKMKNNQVSLEFGGRAKISPQTAIIAEYSQPVTQHKYYQPYAGYGLGVEFTTSSHVFQIFASNYSGIVPQKNYMLNQNQIGNGDILIGFNITKIWDF